MVPTADQLTGWYTTLYEPTNGSSVATFFPNQVVAWAVFGAVRYSFQDDTVTWERQHSGGSTETFTLRKFEYDEKGNVSSASGDYSVPSSKPVPISITRFASFGTGDIPPGTLVTGTFEGIVSSHA